VEPSKSKTIATVLQELGLSYEETLEVMKGVAKDSHYVKRLWKKGDETRLVKIGLALIAFPDPTISDILGTLLVSAGLIQAKMKRSALHVEDVYKTFQDVNRNLPRIKQELVW